LATGRTRPAGIHAGGRLLAGHIGRRRDEPRHRIPQGLKEAGFVEGQSVAIEYRWADGHIDRLPELAADLIRRQVAVVVGHAQVAQIAKAATTTTPIVFVAGDDPVRIGLVANLNRPGGNVTGVTFIATDVAAKRLGLLRELAPRAAVVAVLLDPNLPDADQELRSVEAASRTIGVRILVVKAATPRVKKLKA